MLHFKKPGLAVSRGGWALFGRALMWSMRNKAAD